MKQHCQLTEQCVGFNSKGEFKNRLNPQSKWTRTEDTGGAMGGATGGGTGGGGLYVADIDVCAADLDSCGRHQVCKHTGWLGKGVTRVGTWYLSCYWIDVGMV